MLDKRAELVKLAGLSGQDQLLMAAGGIGSAAIAAVGASLLHKSLDERTNKAFSGLPRTTRPLVERMKQVAGLPQLVDEEIPGLNNAYYLAPQSLAPEARNSLQMMGTQAAMKGDLKADRVAQQILRADAGQGGIFYGEKWNNPYTVAHEMGHALSANEPAFRQFIERSPKTLDMLYGLGMAAGTLGGIAKPEWIPYIGAGLAGLGGLATAATAYTESQANKRGLDLLRRSGVEPSPGGQEALASGERSYLWPKLGTHILAPLAMAGAAKLIQRARS